MDFYGLVKIKSGKLTLFVSGCKVGFLLFFVDFVSIAKLLEDSMMLL